MIELIEELAKSIAYKHHEGITRKDGVTPYITHPEKMVKNLFAYFLMEQNKELGTNRCFLEMKEFKGVPVQVYFATAWLHDTMEDQNKAGVRLTKKDLLEVFYLKLAQTKFTDVDDQIDLVRHWNHVIDNVTLLTKNGENYVKYLEKIAENVIASVVKLVDLHHNMSDLKPGSLLEKYQITMWYILNHSKIKSLTLPRH